MKFTIRKPEPEPVAYALCSFCGKPTRILRAGVPVYHSDCAHKAGVDHGQQTEWAR